MGLESVADLVEIAGRMAPSTVVVAGGHRVGDLRLVESARDHGIIDRIILVGAEDRIARAVEQVGIEVPRQDVVPAANDEEVGRATVELIQGGGIDVVLKGGISTPVMNRHMLPLAVRPTASLTSIFDASPIADGRPMVLTDASVTTVCNFGRMVDLVRNAVDLARVVMRIDRPRVAILSASEKPIPSLPSTWMGAELTKRHWPDAVVYGPLSLDLAIDPGSVATMGVPDVPAAHEVAGRADVLVCPGIDAANVLYKTITAMIKYGVASCAGITLGFPVPYIILSRADALETRLQSIALSSIYAHRNPGGRPLGPPAAKRPAAKTYRILVVNPGSTSMKVAVYENDRCAHEAEVPCDIAVTGDPADHEDRIEALAELALQVLAESGDTRVDAVAARGGFLPRPEGKLAGGTYVVAEAQGGSIVVDDDLVSALAQRPEMAHASNFSVPLAAELARRLEVPAFMTDPVVVDEFIPEAEVSGYAGITRRSTAHALSVREAARRAAQAVGRPLEDVNVVVAHLGGGITIAAVRGGKIIDNTIALLGGGPFTPQRAGQLPTGGLIDLCYSGQFSREELIEALTKHGGLRSYLGEDRMDVIEQRIDNGDEQARLIVDAMIYQIAKEIAAMFVAAGCDVEAIVLTGGLARSARMRTELRRRVGRLAPVYVFEEPLEMAALAAGAVDVLSGRLTPLHYRLPGEPGQTGDAQHE